MVSRSGRILIGLLEPNSLDGGGAYAKLVGKALIGIFVSDPRLVKALNRLANLRSLFRLSYLFWPSAPPMTWPALARIK
jgi:hypothetical protein